jgi:hypothetical protein
MDKETGRFFLQRASSDGPLTRHGQIHGFVFPG